MKIKKIMCSILTAAMVFSSVSIANITNVEASYEDRHEVGVTIKANGGTESVKVTDEKKLVKISVEETGVYEVELSSSTNGPVYDLYSEEAKYLGYLSLDQGELEADYKFCYFVKGRNYYFRCVEDYVLPGNEDVFKCKFVVTKTNLNIDEEVKKSRVAMHAYYYVANGLPEGHNYYLNDDEINKIDGVNWDNEKNVLTFNNYNGPYVFDAWYGLGVCCDTKDYDKKPELTIEFIGENNFAGMAINNVNDYIRNVFFIENIDVNIVGTGTVNISPISVVDKETSELKGIIALPFYYGYEKLCIDGPVINADYFFGEHDFINSSNVVFKSGEINIYSLSASISDFNEMEYYPWIIYSYNLSLEKGTVFVKVEDYTGDNELGASTLLEGREFLNVEKDTLIAVNVDTALYDNKKMYTLGCNAYGTTDCTISKDSIFFVGKDFTKEMVEEIIDSLKKQNEDSNTQTENTKTDVNKSVNENVDNKEVKSVYGPKKGSKLTDKNFAYKVTKSGTTDGKVLGEVEISSLKNKNAKKVVIKDIVTINGVKYKVTSIGKKAFAKCKKLKKVTIKAKGIKSIKKGAFKGVKKSCKIRVPKSKKKAYKKLLKKAKCKAKVK